MIKQKQYSKFRDITLEPWETYQFQGYMLDELGHQAMNKYAKSPLLGQSQTSRTHSKQQQRQNQRNRRTIHNPQQYSKDKIFSSLAGTPTVLSQKKHVNYIKYNQHKIKNYEKKQTNNKSAELSRYGMLASEVSNNKKPLINVTCISYCEEYPNQFISHEQNTFKKTRKRTSTENDLKMSIYGIRKLSKPLSQQGTRNRSKSQNYSNEESHLEKYRNSNHLQKVLKIKEKLRQKTKKRIEEKQDRKKVFLFKQTSHIPQQLPNRNPRLSLKTSQAKRFHNFSKIYTKTPQTELNVCGGSIHI